ncbi:sulfite exporter TauE/SafE family protein [Novosphingobium sp.]|uniref:sulfite exporter TauE/SafE family protein n=1 Tax=Novosphingobium sp. TaxID=1874826 RepID=UPI0038B97F43
MNDILVLAAAGIVAGAMNAIAGGGSFVALPALLSCGVSPVLANASSSVALYPGSMASDWGYRHDLGGVAGASLRSLTLTSLLSGLAGSVLLLATPATLFDLVLPWLLLLALLALAFGQRFAARFRGDVEASGPTILAAQAPLGIYGGYFGGAVGLMMMAFWSVATHSDIKRLQAPRTFLVTAANTAALFVFAAMRAVEWRAVLLLAPSAIAGGYLGAHRAARLPPRWMRAVTLALASLITLAFFARAYA